MGSEEAPRHCQTHYRTCIKGQGPDNIKIEWKQFDRTTLARRGDDHNAASRWRRNATLESGQRANWQRGGNWMGALFRRAMRMRYLPSGDCPGNACQHWLEAFIAPKNASLSTRNNCDCLVALCCRGLGGAERTTRKGTYKRYRYLVP